MPIQGLTRRSKASSRGLASLFRLAEELVSCFQSVHLAIVLLSLLAVGTIIGVIMPQEGLVELADIRQRYGVGFDLLQSLGLFSVYSSFWFVTLEVLLFFNLLIGSFKWLKPAFLAATRKSCIPAELMLQKTEAHSLLHYSSYPKEQTEAEITAVLNRFGYKTHSDRTGNLYACKGNFSRFGPCIAHLGVLFCLVAGVYGSFTGFKALKLIAPGNTFAIAESDTLKTSMSEPIWMGAIPKWKIRIKDFRAEFYPERPDIAKQYYSTLQIISPRGEALQEGTISVNHPLTFDGISIYQASYAPSGRFFLEINGKPSIAELNSQFNQRPVSVTSLQDGSTLIMFPFFPNQDPGVTKNHALFFLRQPGETFPKNQLPPNIRLFEGESGLLKDYRIHYDKPEMATGLQIKRAPEVPLMYLSYLVIVIGTILCFFSQRQLWVALQEVAPGKIAVMLVPKTNKARLSFQKEIYSLQAAMSRSFSQRKPIEEIR